MVNKTKSGDGERTAMLGYVPQYEIAANLIYETLMDESLEWFRVADPDAGSLDDIVIATTGKLDAYQVKWTEFTREISYSDFVRETTTKKGNKKPSLFRQLAEGWKIFYVNYKEKAVTVHLLHKLIPSSNTQAEIPLGKILPEHPHFQAFLKECWLDRSWCHTGIDEAPMCWKETLMDLKRRSGFNEADFLKFTSYCDLEFNYKLPSDLPGTNRGQARKQEDVIKIYNLLTKMAGGERRIIEMSKGDMLDNLGWGYRFKHKFVHEFPINQAYQEITETVGAISDILSKKSRGYIALLGSPGAGKSTTLTQTLKYKSGYKLVRYYAYVPDSAYQGRGEANTFLHDITLSLRNHGYRGESSGHPGSRDEYLSLLGEQLQQANEKWRSDGLITIIMVDGLDHIQREQNPLQSLLSDLPPPNTIPDGVIFFLGSQTLELTDLSDAIKEHVKQESRTIVLSPLTRPNVYKIITEWPGCSELTNDNKRKVFEKSHGHPLSLVYFLQFFTERSNFKFDDVLDKFPAYQGHIGQSYSIYWRQVEGNKELVHLLALLSRIRVPINTKTLEKWFDHSTLYQFISSASHYFKKDSNVSWQFFHNSFRQFILDKTSRDLFGNFDASKNIDYHKTLADYCLQSSADDLMRWQAIFHLFNARNMEAVIDIGKQSYFREQFFCLRNLTDVTDDIDCVLLAAKELSDPLAIVRCILIECELRERKDALNEVDVLNLLFASEGIDSALSYMFDGPLLRISDSEALIFSKNLVENEFFNDAKRVFDAAEPLSYLSGNEGVDPSHGGAEVLKRWVDVAHDFLSLDKIFSIICQTRYEEEPGSCKESDKELHIRLIKRLIKSICEGTDEEKVNQLFSFFSHKEEYFYGLLDVCFLVCINKFPQGLKSVAFQVVAEWAETQGEGLDYSDRLLTVELDYRTNGDIDRSKSWFKDIDQPGLYKHGLYSQWKNLSPFTDRIRLNRMLAALGKNIDPIALVPNEYEKYTGNVLFERNLIRFSSIWGKAWKGELLSPSFIVREIKPSFELFQKPHSETKNWIGWYEFQNAAVDYFKFAIKATSQHGRDCVLALADAFRQDWEKRYWPTSWRREIAFTLFKQGSDQDGLIIVLDQIEKEIPEFDEVHSRISEYYELSIIWSNLDKFDRAAKLVPKIFIESFGLYHRKDRQFSHWVSWLGKLVNQYPDLAHEEICRFSLALINLEQSGNGRGTQEAARDLISIATAWNAKYGLQLLRWLFDQKGLHYGPGLTGFLSGILNRPDPPLKEISVIVGKLLIPFEEYNPSELSKQLTYHYHISSPIAAEKEIDKLVTSISTHLLPSNRYSWFEGIALGLREAGKDNSKYAATALATPQKKYATHEPCLKLKTGEQLTEDEAQLKVCSIENLFQLLRSVESVDYFRWLDLIQPYLKEMDIDQLRELNKLLQPFLPDNSIVSAIAGAFGERGEVGEANTLLGHLLNNSRAEGWDLHWDGGSRQSIFKALVEIDAKQWRPKAIACLVDDYISEYRHPSNLIWNLEEIIYILFESIDMLPVWKEIKDHIYQLDCFQTGDERPPALPSESGVTSDSGLLIQLTFDMFDVGISELEYMAHQAIVAFLKLRKNWPTISKEVINRINTAGLTQVKIISLLQSLVDNCKDFVVQFANEISSLCASEDFSTRMIALELSERLEIAGFSPPQGCSTLPLVYELELPKIENKKEAIPFSAIQPGETLPDVDDSIELLRPLITEAKLVAEMSNIRFENLVCRASELMKTLVPQQKWNRQAEIAHREWMEGFDLKLTYRRLRPQIAKLALSHVACELLDANRIPLPALSLLNTIFKRCDNLLLSLEPAIRPEYIVIPNARDREIPRHHDKWLRDIDQAFSQCVDNLQTGKEVIGELTRWVWLDWDMPTEMRMSTICHPEWNSGVDIKSPSTLFPSMMHWSASDYPEILATHEPSLVIYGSGAYIDHGGLEWLAFNPTIGFSLGWSVSSQGLFRWLDEKGNIMVESIYWKDGPISRLPPKMDDICSNGWLVIASSEAAEQIRRAASGAVRVNTIIRSYGKGSHNPITESAQQRANW